MRKRAMPLSRPPARLRCAAGRRKRFRRNLSLTALYGLAAGLMGLPCAAQTTTTQTPQTPPPTQAPLGVTPLPQTPPPTGLQAPLPPPALPLRKADHPLLQSPGLAELSRYLPTRPITINEAVAVALAVNRSLALANESLLLAQGRTAEARAALNPNVGASFVYTRLSQGQSANFGGQTINIVNADQPVLSAQVTLPVDIVGLLRAATDQARFQEIAFRLDVNRARNQLVSDVKSAFYAVLRDQALVRVATDNLQDSLDRLTDAQTRFRAGVVARFDVIRAQTDVANSQQQLIAARNDVSLAIATLNNTIGIDVDTPLQVSDTGAVENPPGVAPPSGPAPAPATGTTPAPSSPQAAPTPPTPAPNAAAGGQNMQTQNAAPNFNSLVLGPEYNAVLHEALQTRPEILEGDADIAAARKGIVIARRSQLPALNLSLGGSYSPNNAGFSPQTTTGQFVLSLSVPLYDGGTARARVEQARANVATAQTNRRQAVDTVTLDVRQAYLSLAQARDQVAVANQALAEAQESFRLARVRYNAGVSGTAGVSPLLEVSDAQAALTQAEINQVNALYAYNNARALLDRAAGRYSYVVNGPGYSAPPPPNVTGSPGTGAGK